MKKQTENRDISHYLTLWYFQNYSKLHYLSYFNCIIFVCCISATEQWRVKHVAWNVTAEFKSFIFTSVPPVNLLPISLEMYPQVHSNACNLQSGTEYSCHLDLCMTHECSRQQLSTCLHVENMGKSILNWFNKSTDSLEQHSEPNQSPCLPETEQNQFPAAHYMNV